MTLDPARWERMRTLFQSAIERPASARRDFVASACGADRSLCADLEVLLRAHDEAGSFISSPVVGTALSWGGDTTVDLVSRSQEFKDPRLEGRIISHYRVNVRLGAGGMGIVYGARDLALGREVALKILPDSLTPALRARLLREADACARLQHPAIATYYESGDVDGIAFIAMELVHGQTLRERLRLGVLPVDEAVAIAVCVLEGLSHAHAAGILHRDIKPENIIVTKNRAAKVLDFGLAKDLLAGSPKAMTQAALTSAHAIVGTIGYMSPEQVRNDPMDVRSDLFQVGAVLYEALTGRPAFPGDTIAERVAAVLLSSPAPLTGGDIPPALNAVVARALARDPERRYPSAAGFLSDLNKVSAGEWVADLPDTLAILDLQNVTGVAADDWIGSGMAESLGLELSRTSGLSVVPRERVLKARAAVKSTSLESAAVELGLTLGCRWVLAGSYQRLGPALRVTTRLVEASTGDVVAIEKLDGTVEQLFEMQDRLAAATCGSLKVSASPAAERTQPKLSAYECYARGRRFFDRLEKGPFDQARELYEQATTLDPTFAPALTGLASIYAMRYTFTSDPSTLEAALSFAGRAMAVDPKSAEPHVWLGYALWRGGQVNDALTAWRGACELAPDLYLTYYFSAQAILSHTDLARRAEGLQLAQRAVELDPRAAFALVGLASYHLKMGNYEEAEWCFKHASRLNELPDASQPMPGIGGLLSECLRLMGRLGEARAECLEGLEEIERTDFMYRDSYRVNGLVLLGRIARQQGDREAARAAFQQAIVHVRGRPRTLGGGALVVEALAGLACVGEGLAAYQDACALYEARTEFDFSWLPFCSEEVTLLDLARAAHAVGRLQEASSLVDRARRQGSIEAQQESWA